MMFHLRWKFTIWGQRNINVFIHTNSTVTTQIHAPGPWQAIVARWTHLVGVKVVWPVLPVLCVKGGG